MKKYELTDTTIMFLDHTLHQIRYLRDVGYNIKAGDLGGWVETEKNLSQHGNAAVCGNAKVFDCAMVYNDAMIFDNATVRDYATVCDSAKVCGYAIVSGDAIVRGDAIICDDAKVCGNATVFDRAVISGNAKIEQIYDLIVIGPIGSRHSFTSFYRTKDEKIFVSCGCFCGDINAFRNKVRETHADCPKHLAAYFNAADFAEKLIGGR